MIDIKNRRALAIRTLAILAGLACCILISSNCYSQQNCTDSIQAVKFSSPYFNLSGQAFQTVTTADNGTVVFQPAYTPGTITLFKIDAADKIAWNKRITTGLNISGVLLHEMSNGNIALAGETTDNGGNYKGMIMLMLNTSGQLLWQKIYNDANAGAQAFNNVTSINEGINGEIVITAATTVNMMVASFNSSGNINWVRQYSGYVAADNYTTPNNAFVVDGLEYVCGFETKGLDTAAIWILQLDHATGHTLKYKSWQIITPASGSGGKTSFTAPGSRVAYLANGVFVFSSGFSSGLAQNENIFVQVDTNLAIVHTPMEVYNENNTVSYLAGTNKQGLSPVYMPADNGLSGYYAFIDSTNVLRQQRKLTNAEAAEQTSVGIKNNNSLGVITALAKTGSNVDYGTTDASPEFISGAGCTGVDAVAFTSATVTCLLVKYTFNYVTSDYPAVAANIAATAADFSANAEVNCKQLSSCDSLKINGPKFICLGDSSAVFTAYKNPACLKVINWLTDTTAFSGFKQVTNTTVSVKFSQPVKRYLYADVGSCGLKDSVLIDVRSYARVALGNDTTLCENTQYTLHPADTYKTYRWQDGSTAHTYTITQAGKYYVTVTDSCGFTSADTINISYSKQGQVVSLGVDTVLCPGDSYVLQPAFVYKLYRWQNGSSYNAYTVTKPGKYYVTVTDGCNTVSADTVLVDYYTAPRLFSEADTSLCYGKTITLTATTGFASYLWQPAYGVDNPSAQAVHANPLNTTTYTVTATGYHNCTVQEDITVTVNVCTDSLYMPTIFTPNGDGHNDVIRPIFSGDITSCQFNVYNRWGKLVFHSATRGAGWDGTINGHPQPGGTYIWFCQFKFDNKPLQMAKGTLVLLR